MTKGSSSRKGQIDHDLANLIGKKIKNITMTEVDVNGDQSNIRQFYVFSCSDGEKLVLACDGGSEKQFATATLWELDDYQDFLEEVEEEFSLLEEVEDSSTEDDELEEDEEEDEGFEEEEDLE